MIEKLLSIYAMSMAYDIRSPMPHLVGPPGCGKSSFVEELAELLGVNLHTINVSRLSPLDVEGVQMPHASGEEMVLRMLPATYWTRLKEGDILLMDEFLRGFPEVYNALLDIFTSRKVGSFVLPRVFIIGASNSFTAYDSALTDRLLHIPVADPRKSKAERMRLKQFFIDSVGLMPEMVKSSEMDTLLEDEVLPMYDVLDVYTSRKSVQPDFMKGRSLRNLIGQAQMREIQSVKLKELIDLNNTRAVTEDKLQYCLFYRNDMTTDHYLSRIEKIKDNPKLSDVQRLNIAMNTQLIELWEAKEKETP